MRRFCSAAILLVPMQEGAAVFAPAQLEIRRRDAGGTKLEQFPAKFMEMEPRYRC
jgi:hypothetical protein